MTHQCSHERAPASAHASAHASVHESAHKSWLSLCYNPIQRLPLECSRECSRGCPRKCTRSGLVVSHLVCFHLLCSLPTCSRATSDLLQGSPWLLGARDSLQHRHHPLRLLAFLAAGGSPTSPFSRLFLNPLFGEPVGGGGAKAGLGRDSRNLVVKVGLVRGGGVFE